MRVVSWNVRSLRDDARGVADVLRGLEPDVVVLQEAPRLLGWRLARARLARLAGLVPVTGGRPAAGNLLLRAPGVHVVSASSVRMPRRPGLHRRGAVLALLEVDGCRVAVAGSHLDLDACARLDSAERVRALLPDGVPSVLGVDVNEQPPGPAWTAVGAGLVDVAAGCGPTFPLRRPDRRIDGVFVSSSLQVVAVDVPRTPPVTDHLPIVVELDLGGG